MSRLKSKAPEEPVETGPKPYDIGLHESVDDLYQADKAAKEDLAAKKAAYEKHDKKMEGIIGTMFYSIKKRERLRDAYRAAQDVPHQIHEGLRAGAFQAFLDGRHENLQEILFYPGEFRRLFENGDDNLSFVMRTLVTLLDKSTNPDAVPDTALEKFAEDNKQNILSTTLLNVVKREYIGIDIERTVSTLLKAGAGAGCEPISLILAEALTRDHSTKVTDMLLENGADIEEALQIMHDYGGNYSYTAEKLEAIQYKIQTDTRISELEETIAELTGKPAKEAPASPAPSAPAETATPSQIGRFRKVDPSPQ